MGLRFRKSISLCKGVKLNFGKTGMSVSLGTKGYHKTISTSGRVTTTVGVPGTGIYYTDTKNLVDKTKIEISKVQDHQAVCLGEIELQRRLIYKGMMN